LRVVVVIVRLILRRRLRRRLRRLRIMNEARDRVGLGWRPPLAAGILGNLDRIDVVEVMAEDFMDGPAARLRALGTLSAQVPIVVHGVSLGLASADPVDRTRLDRFARVVARAQPLFWSEHLAFVRGGGLEIGHLAAPPRTAATIEGAAANVHRAAAVVGATPLLENIATLMAPPGPMDEATWIDGVLRSTGSGLLLDLHNLHANILNFGGDPRAFLDRIGVDRIAAVHLAGGRWIATRRGEARLLDDHLHDVPQAVYDLLTEVAARARQPLTVILERDGAYPPIERLLAELDRARAALSAGRARASAFTASVA
jgi:uncharacterized protein (UPF0276 family)